MTKKQKKQIKQRLEAEAASESRGFVGDGRVGHRGDVPNGIPSLDLKGKGEGPAGWSLPQADVEARPLASLEELLDVARSEER
jgi:hypothetical protein